MLFARLRSIRGQDSNSQSGLSSKIQAPISPASAALTSVQNEDSAQQAGTPNFVGSALAYQALPKGSTALSPESPEGSGLPLPGSPRSAAEGAQNRGSKKSDKEKAIEAADLMKDIEELPEMGRDLIEDEDILVGTALDAQDDNLVCHFSPQICRVLWGFKLEHFPFVMLHQCIEMYSCQTCLL